MFISSFLLHCPPNSLFGQVDTRYEYESVHEKTFLIRGPVLCFVMGSKTLSAGLFVLPGFELGPVLHGSLGAQEDKFIVY